MGNVGKMIAGSEQVIQGLLGIGLLGILYLVLYGNLSGNLGFAANTLGANNTNQVIGNLTGGIVTFFSFSNVLFTLTAISLLIGIILVVVNLVRGGKGGDSSGFSG